MERVLALGSRVVACFVERGCSAAALPMRWNDLADRVVGPLHRVSPEVRSHSRLVFDVVVEIINEQCVLLTSYFEFVQLMGLSLRVLNTHTLTRTLSLSLSLSHSLTPTHTHTHTHTLDSFAHVCLCVCRSRYAPPREPRRSWQTGLGALAATPREPSAAELERLVERRLRELARFQHAPESEVFEAILAEQVT